MNLYPNDSYLPSIEETVVHDDQTDGEEIFKEETARMSEHPAELFTMPSESFGCESSERSDMMLEKMGVTDPECNKVPG